jgi:hypothetical protein
MDIPTHMPTILKIMMVVVSIITVILMGILIVKIYRDEARNDDAGPKNTGW